MNKRSRWQALTAAAIASLLLLGMAALGTGAQAAGGLTKCGTKTYIVELPLTTVPPTVRKYTEHAENINVSGISCSSAFKFLKLLYTSKTGTIPEHYKCITGKVKEPVGYFEQVCTHGGAKIEYGHHGG